MSRLFIILALASIPLILYFISFFIANKKALSEGNEKPKFFSRKLYDAFVLSLMIAIGLLILFICFYFYQLEENDKYVPAYMKDEQLIRGHRS